MLWMLIIAVLILAAIVSPMMGITRVKELERQRRTTAYILCGLSSLSMALSLLASISAALLLLWGGYTYLRHGAGPLFPLVFVAPVEWPEILVLIIGLPVFFHYLTKALVSRYKAYALASVPRKS
jgi:hypothetical protein